MCVTNNTFFVLHEEEDFLIIIKPRGISCVPLKQKSILPDLCTLVFEKYPQARGIQSKTQGEGGLLHRLDRDTEGMVLFAKTQDFYNYIQQQAKEGLFKKSYLAHCFCQKPDLSPQGYTRDAWANQLQNFTKLNCTFSCSFVKAEARTARVRAIQHLSRHSNNKIYTTKIALRRQKDYIQAFCHLQQGFRHQVRASLCALGLPIIGDPFYPNPEEKSQKFSFWATGLCFIPLGKKQQENFHYNPQDFVNRF